MKIITRDQIEIVGLRKLWLGIALLAVIVSLAFIFIDGFDMDTDFAGGISLQYDLHTPLDKEELDSIRELVDSIDGITVTSIQKSGDDSSCVVIKARDAAPEVVEAVYTALNIKYGAPLIDAKEETTEDTEEATEEATEDTTEEVTEEATEEVTEETAEEVTEETTEETTEGTTEEATEETPVETPEETPEEEIVYGGEVPVEVLSESRIGASISNEIRRSAVIATVIAVVLMLLYITLRFEFRSAIATVICLIHDIIIVIGAYAIFDILVSANLIAAVLTILGYSINATIILFDRVRENKKKMGKTDFGVIINTSVRQTLTRSINTTITTLLTIGMIYLLGVHSIKEFALPIIVGLVAGLYSSLFVSGSVWYMLSPKKR